MQSGKVTVFENSIGYYSFCYPTDKKLLVEEAFLRPITSNHKRIKHIASKGYQAYLLCSQDGASEQIVWRKS